MKSAIFLDKQNLHNIPNFYKYHELYDNLASKLAENIKITSKTTVIVDKSKSKHEDIQFLMKDFHQVLIIPIIIQLI